MRLPQDPTLDELATDPDKIKSLALETLYAVERMAERLSFACRLEMLQRVVPTLGQDPVPVPERLLKPAEAAAALGLAKVSLLRRRHLVPYRDLIVPVPGTRNVRFSASRVEQYLKNAVHMHAPGGSKRLRV
jgi:hypothetical protein